MASVELASAYLSLIPSLKGAGRTISSELSGISMAPVGAKMGAGLSKGIGASMKSNISAAIVAPVAKALESQATATSNLGRAESNLTKARAGQQTAQAKVATAEEKLASLRDSGTASSAELKTAEANLNAAKVALADSNVKVGTSEDAATRAKESATAANAAYVDSLKQSSTVSGKLQTALPIIGAQIKDVGGQWKTAGTNISGVGKSMTTKFTAPVVTAATAVGGLVTALGFKRLVGIDTARGQFKGLGYDADEVMAQVDKGVTNTALSMADGASLAVGVLATGAVPMKDLEAQLKRTANVSAAYGVDSAHAGNLLNAVLTKNKVTYGDLSQMQANGIPIISQLADHYGVAGDQIEKMARDGKISIEDMNTVLDKNAGKAAEEYAKTWKGVTSNIMSNLGKFGASVFEDVFPKIKSSLEEFLVVLKSPELKEFGISLGTMIGDAFTNISTAIQGAITWWNQLSPSVQKFIGVAAGVVLVAGPVLMIVGKIVMTIGALITAFGSIVSVIGTAIPVIKALNAVMRANVIGIVITAIAALVAGLIWFFTQTDVGREIWGGFVNWLKDLWTGLSTFFSEVWTNITTFFTEAWANIVAFFAGAGPALAESWAAMWQGIADFFTGIWESIKTFLGAAFEFIKMIFFNFHPIGIIIANWQPIMDFLVMLWDGIKLAVAVALAWIQSKIASISAGISSAWNATWSAISSFFGNVWAGIKVVVGAAINWVRTTVSNVVNNIRSAWSAAWSAIGSFLANVWAGIKAAVSSAVNSVRSTISNVVRGIQSVWNSVWGSIRSFFSTIWGGIVSAASSFMGAVRDRFQSVMDFVRGVPGKIIGFFSGLGSSLVASGRSLISGFLDGIMAGFNRAKDAVAGGLSKIRNLFPFSPAKEGPFSGRGWVAYSGLSIGETFSQSVAGALHDGRKEIGDELGGIQDEFDSISEPTFGVRTAVPYVGPGDPYGTGSGADSARQIVLQVENLTVDSEDRVQDISQALWTRANRADRSKGKVSLAGVTV